MLANWFLLFLCVGATIQGNVSAFDPSSYEKSAARCMTTRRAPVQEDVHIDLGTLFPPFQASELQRSLSSISGRPLTIYYYYYYPEYVEINSDASTTLLMIHGWPSLWSTWSKQIEAFQVRRMC